LGCDICTEPWSKHRQEDRSSPQLYTGIESHSVMIGPPPVHTYTPVASCEHRLHQERVRRRMTVRVKVRMRGRSDAKEGEGEEAEEEEEDHPHHEPQRRLIPPDRRG